MGSHTKPDGALDDIGLEDREVQQGSGDVERDDDAAGSAGKTVCYIQQIQGGRSGNTIVHEVAAELAFLYEKTVLTSHGGVWRKVPEGSGDLETIEARLRESD